RLAVCWLAAGVVGLGLVSVNWLWGWQSPLAIGFLCLAGVAATITVLYRSRRLEPDYRAVARNIERRHPDLKALLLAAVEQEPAEPGGQLGYLQKQVLKEALVHATDHDWEQSISRAKLVLADLGWGIALVSLLVILSQGLPPTSLVLRSEKEAFFSTGYDIAVTPGDTSVEFGASVVVLARFGRRVPDEASLRFGGPGEELQQVTLTRNLDDPVFGGVISDVRSDLRYHIEYAGNRTREYAIGVYQSPQLTRADARIVYPDYTKLPDKRLEDVRQLSVVEGSEVTLIFRLNKPVTSARLVPKTGIALGLSVDEAHPNVLFTSMTATESERYELHLADAQGRSNKMPPRFTIDVHKNLPPEITPVFPNRDVVLSALEELVLEAEVTDDYGATGYGITYTLVGAESESVSLGGGEASAATPQIQYLLALEELGAEPDQLLTYHFWANDVGPEGQPRRTASDIYFAEVRHFEEIFLESQSSQRQQGQGQGNQQQDRRSEQLARLQKQIISATWNIKQQAELSGGIEDRKDDLDVVRQSQAEVLEQARGASAQAEDPESIRALAAATNHMETSLNHLTTATETVSATELTPALGAEQAAYQELLKLKQREHQVGRGQNASRGGNANRSANSARFEQQLQQLELTQRENRYETQRLAQSRQQESQREDLQVLNRLRDLARRQNAMAERLKEAQAALRQARNEQARQEVLRELRRLRDEQLETLRDMDELEQRMEDPQNRRRMAQTREQLDESRAGVRQSTDELEQGMLSQAITSTTRAGRQLEEIRDEFRRRTSGQFVEEMRNMRDRAQQLDRQQDEIAEEMEEQLGSRQRTLTGSNVNRELADRMEQQRADLEELIDEMKDVSEQSELSEPLLSRKLYDTLRKASTGNTDRALETASELLRRNLLPQAQELERRAGEGIEAVREGVEDASRSVLGDEEESLRLAREQLDEAIRQVNEETARAGGERAEDRPDSQRQAGGRPQDGQAADRQQEPSERQRPGGAEPQGPPRGGGRRGNTDTRTARSGGRERPNRAGGGGGEVQPERWEDIEARGPLTGADYKQWSDQLRDVEEMLTERDLREEVARVRDRAKGMRAEFVRHGTEPQWDLVRTQITRPLNELRQQISEKLAQLQSDDALVPIDRDPVPERFAEVVRRYFENLGDDDR
ncbi:MAG: coiled-coil domain-containing protein, partial [Planctomycetota bacterium]